MLGILRLCGTVGLRGADELRGANGLRGTDISRGNDALCGANTFHSPAVRVIARAWNRFPSEHT